MRIAVIDDEAPARRAIHARLAAAGLVATREYADGDAALRGLRESPVDLVFLDVSMPGRDGLSVLAALPAAVRPLAILLTAHSGFAVRAFELGAVDYLLKPIDPARFAEALARAGERWGWRRAAAPPVSPSARPLRFAVRIGRSERYVAVADIRWIEADGDYAMLHTARSAYPLRQSLQELAVQLDPACHLRVHRSAIVRLDCIAELKPLSNRDALLRLDDGTPVRVSRNYIDALLDALTGRSGSEAAAP
jgi:two-component system LytT family response regulator